MKLNGKALLIAGVVLVALLLEAAVIVLIMPGKGDVAAATQAGESGPPQAEPDEAPVADEAVEVLVDTFNCTNNRVSPGSVVHLSFKVICVVPPRQGLSFEEAANNKHKTRVRQAIESIARKSSLEDLNDPSLSAMKRLIKDEVNKILGKNYVLETVVTDFRMMEQ